MDLKLKYDTGSHIKSYTLYVDQIAKIADMAERLGVKQSEVVRRAIDNLWNVMEDEQDNGHES